ncbi:hypothetical protein [Rathayibacter sp. Leaf299]|jgi:hypothetical protein|nr:hypothetical protein [Rathayibacter sp. Leaf299]
MLSTDPARPDSALALLGSVAVPLTVVDLGDSVDFFLATVARRD